jgi:hypothetical protein
MRINIKSLLAVAMLVASFNVFAAPAQITVDIDKPGHTISPLLWGIFFEDINLSADGGLYPELVRNRSFEGSDELRYWKFTSSSANSTWAVDASRPLNPFNRHCLRVKAEGGGTLENEGYWGMNFVAGNACTFTVAARSTDTCGET